LYSGIKTVGAKTSIKTVGATGVSIKTVGATAFGGLWALEWAGGFWALEWAWHQFVGVRVGVAL